MFKQVAILLVAIFAIQAASALPSKQLQLSEKGIIDSILKPAIDLAKSLIADALKLVTSAVNSAVDSLQVILNSAVDVLLDYAAKAVAEVDKIIDAALATIQQVVKSAQDLGLDVIGCLGTVNEVLQALKQQSIADITACVTDRKAQLLQIVNAAINVVRDFLKQIDKLATDLINCGSSSLSSLTCITSIGAQATALGLQLPSKIIAVVADVTTTTGQIAADLLKCVTKETSDLILEVNGPASNVVDCINNLIHNEINP